MRLSLSPFTKFVFPESKNDPHLLWVTGLVHSNDERTGKGGDQRYPAKGRIGIV
jgi:hypothetical protein